jgi:hypothetical protein
MNEVNEVLPFVAFVRRGRQILLLLLPSVS